MDLLFEHLLQGRSNNVKEHRLEDGKENLVLGLPQLDVEIVNLHRHLVQFDKVLTVLLMSCGGCDLEPKALVTEEDVHDPLVCD